MDTDNTIVKLEDFFDFNSQKPINRLAYTEADLEYKVKVIKKMQELGMKIDIDKAGNICGTIALGENPTKTIAIGSHTDSVYDGGQYDGPVGVISALKTAEEIIKRKNCNGILKVAIYACEESSRFGNACVGSKYLSKKLSQDDFEKYIDKKVAKETGQEITLKSEIEKAREYLKGHVEGIEEVERIFEEVDYSLEVHIEQYESLDKKVKKAGKPTIGIIDSVGSAFRLQYNVKGEPNHSGSTPMKKRRNPADTVSYIGLKVWKLGKRWEKEGLGRASQLIIGTIDDKGSLNQIAPGARGSIDFRLIGQNTPENALEEFNKIKTKAEKKFKTHVTEETISKGLPAITSKKLNSKIADICEELNINYHIMASYPGQDTGYIPARKKTMIFIPSTEGSHNPKESTTREAIEESINIFINLTEDLLKQKEMDRKYKVNPNYFNKKDEEKDNELKHKNKDKDNKSNQQNKYKGKDKEQKKKAKVKDAGEGR